MKTGLAEIKIVGYLIVLAIVLVTIVLIIQEGKKEIVNLIYEGFKGLLPLK